MTKQTRFTPSNTTSPLSLITLSSVLIALNSPVASQTLTTTPDSTNWLGDWSGGEFENGTLTHIGNNPQEVKRQFSPSEVSTSHYIICYDFSIDVVDNPNQAYGIRMMNERPGNGTYEVVWKSDVNDGNLTFLGGNNTQFEIDDPAWNIKDSLSTIKGETYQMCIDINPVQGQNPGQYSGTYSATVTRISDSESYSTGELSWRSSNIQENDFDEIAFYNSFQGTTLSVDNVFIGSGASIPEPSGILLTLIGFTGLLFRRSRNPNN